jgi:DNA-binding CsgD family transcriptional regulator
MQPHFDENWFPEELFRNTAPVTPPTPVSKAFEPEVYVWQVHGKPIMVHVNLEVVDRLQHDLFEATYYGNEVNGILLGRVAVTGSRSTFLLEDYELVSDCTPNGGSALAKQKHLADIAAKWKAKGGERHAIGLFRSQTRGWLALGEQDVDIANCLFPRADNIFLLVRSSPGAEPRAGFFFWEEGHIRANESYSEFAFDSSVLRTQSGNRIHVLDAKAERWTESAPRRALPSSWLTIGLTWGVALASTLTCVNALNTADRNPTEAAIQAPAPTPTKFEVDYHGQKIKINLNHGLPSDLERENGPLSERQRQLLRYVAEDLPNHDIAFRLGLAPEAVEVHKQALSHKLGVAGDAGLVRYAIKSGLVQP